MIGAGTSYRPARPARGELAVVTGFTVRREEPGRRPLEVQAVLEIKTEQLVIACVHGINLCPAYRTFTGPDALADARGWAELAAAAYLFQGKEPA